MFAAKGLEFLDIIITEVMLPEDVKQPLDMKAQFGSLNEMEREKYNFDMRIINDNEELELLKQRRYEQRDSINEDFSKQKTLKNRELEVVKANAKKSVAEIIAYSNAEQAQIEADSILTCETIKGDTQIIKSSDEAIGRSEAELIEVEAKNSCNKSIAAKMNEIADLKADTV